ncbi:MAG: hypothetical protein AB1600_04250 [Bacteroidota bacterium]
MKYVSMITLFGLLLTGCSGSSYHLKVVDAASGEVFLTFSKGSTVQVGDVFVLYAMGQSHGSGGGGHHDHGGGGNSQMPEIIGYVKVTEIFDQTHGKVEVLSGRVDERAVVERVDKK